MLSDLKFVKGAVAKKDFQPALTHFLIKDGRVLGYDGVIALSSPIDLDIQVAPKAIDFVRAIERCESETTAINLLETGKIRLRSGRRRFTVECIEDKEVLEYIKPEGEDVSTPQKLLEAITSLSPFIGTDASRPWSSGILLRGHSAYATNNIILAQYWIGEQMPDINLPRSAVEELRRIGQTPERVQLGTNSVTFFFEGDRWLRSQLLSTDWPDVDMMLDRAFAEEKNMVPLPENFFGALDTVKPFAEKENRVMFRESAITTSLEGEAGASVEIDGLPDYGTYNIKMLELLIDRVQKIDFTRHPQPCPFVGEYLRGVMLGMNE